MGTARTAVEGGVSELQGDDSRIFGRLGSLSLNDIIQLLSMSRRTATLVLEREDARGTVYFRDGRILHAEAAATEGEDALVHIVQWSDAEFTVQEGVASLPKISIESNTEALLLRTLTRLDEDRNGHGAKNRASARGRSEARPQRTSPAEASAGESELEPDSASRRLPGRPVGRPLPAPRRRAPRRARRPVVLGTVAAAVVLPTAMLLLLPAGLLPRELWEPAPWDELPEVARPAVEAAARANRTPGEADSLLESGKETRPSSQPASPAAEGTSRPKEVGAGSETRAVIVPETARVGHLTVVVEPWAHVLVDGEPAGETPLASIALSPGTHRITLSNPNVLGVIRDEVEIAAGETSTERYSFRDAGELLVLVEPWAEISIDGRDVGQTPMGKIRLPVGSHRVRLRHPQLGEEEREVQIDRGETTTLRVILAERTERESLPEAS